MIHESYLHFFHLGDDHFDYINGTYLQDIGDDPGIASSYRNVNNVNLNIKNIQKLLSKLYPVLDMLIVEDEKPDMIPVINAALDALGDRGNIGICPDVETLNKLIDIIPSAPKVMTLDLQLTKRVGAEEAIQMTREAYQKIAESSAWNDTVVIAISNHARIEVATDITKALHCRGDSLYRKDLRHLPKILPDIFVDALTKQTHRSRLNAMEETISDLEFQKITTTGKQDEISGFIGQSPATLHLKQRLKKYAPTKVKVLLLGESGTGKEVAAKYIHEHSPQSTGEFIAINVSAIPNDLIESELFGYKKGAASNAYKDKKGAFDLAENGTLFLDEIGDLDLRLQSKLLRVMQDGDFWPLGAEKPHFFSGRLILATCKNIIDMVDKGEFREDLYWRIAGCTIELPPLRARKEDIPALIRHFTKKIGGTYQNDIQLTDKALDYLINFNYPGNIRMLETIIEKLCIECEKNEAVTVEKINECMPVLPKGYQNIDTNQIVVSSVYYEDDPEMNSMYQQLNIVEQGFQAREKRTEIGQKLWPNLPKTSAGARVSQWLKNNKTRRVLKTVPDREQRYPKILNWYAHHGHEL